MQTWEWVIAVGVAVVAIAELIQVAILNVSVRRINKKLDRVVPDDTNIGGALSEALFCFMKDISTDEEKAQIVGQFVRGAALAGFEEIKTKIPLLAGATKTDEIIDRIGKRNPWAALGFEVIKMMPEIKAQVEQARGATPSKSDSKRMVGYG